MKKIITILALITVALIFVGCGGNDGPKINTDSELGQEFIGAPEWVIEGRGQENKKIYGVGSVNGTKNIALARSSAQGRGRTEIARSLQLKVKSMLKDYQASSTGGEEFNKNAWDEQYIEDTSKQITDISLSGTVQENTWMSGTGTLWILMAMDVERFKDSIKKMGTLSEGMRDYIAANAARSFAELDNSTN